MFAIYRGPTQIREAISMRLALTECRFLDQVYDYRNLAIVRVSDGRTWFWN